MTNGTTGRMPQAVETFDVPAKAVAALVSHTMRCREHRPTFAQMYEGRYRKDGRDVPTDSSAPSPTQDEVDLTKVPPAVWLVKDQGVYLMSNGLPLDRDENGETRVVYLPGLDPRTDEGWHERARAVFGGDDFVVALPAEEVARTLAACGDMFTVGVDKEAVYLMA